MLHLGPGDPACAPTAHACEPDTLREAGRDRNKGQGRVRGVCARRLPWQHACQTPCEMLHMTVESATQGYEAHLLEGGRQTLLGGRIPFTHSDVAPAMMASAGSDATDYLEQFAEACAPLHGLLGLPARVPCAWRVAQVLCKLRHEELVPTTSGPAAVEAKQSCHPKISFLGAVSGRTTSSC